MSADHISSKTVRQKVWIAVRFVLFGFVGLWVMLAFTVAFALRVFDYEQHIVSPFLSLPLALVGALMILYGVGEWGRWAYLWVFLAIPISLCLLLLVPGTGNSKELPVVVAAVAAIVSYGAVRAYYALPIQKETYEHDRAP